MATTTAPGPGEAAYFAAGAHFGSERRRLDLLEQRYDSVTFERLRAVGVGPGWRCLEVGAGGGSVARWLAETVGPDGLVVATDIDTRFLGHLRGRIEVRRHDILTDPIEPQAYDLIHCRSLLMHLPDPAAALTRMATMLRPGGWLIAENTDYSSFTAASTHPRAADWNRAAAQLMAVVEDHGPFAPNLGRRLPQLVAQTGLRVVTQDGRTSVQHGGDPVAQLRAQSFVYLAGLAAFAGAGPGLEAVLAGLDDPTFEFVDATNFGVSARNDLSRKEGKEMMTERPHPPLPYEFLPEVPSFAVTSDDIADGKALTDDHLYNGFGVSGGNLSPHLRWEGFPPETQGFAITCFDPDAPTGSGFWHWVLFDIPPDVTELPRGAGSGTNEGLPKEAIHARSDFGSKDFGGAAPPEGHGLHRYVFAVHALDCDSLGLDTDVTPAIVGFNLTFHTLARGLITPVYGR